LIFGIVSAISAIMAPVAYFIEGKFEIFSAGLFWPRIIFIFMGISCALAGLYSHSLPLKEKKTDLPIIFIAVGGGLSILSLILEIAVF
jgi:hypothetical protein